MNVSDLMLFDLLIKSRINGFIGLFCALKPWWANQLEDLVLCKRTEMEEQIFTV
ncbi:hypothetical protein AXF42_Ash011327 [Apostasia shenzhenica]|uniref:Uncharacterized protein n=1 Tax=Apostasia shenzhenica TaxID=1088818 RepID=A0A2I0AE66_9ASPA|nr:hypothetical protein AXF42_Ash011327 [Apostasia shenzhenica]